MGQRRKLPYWDVTDVTVGQRSVANLGRLEFFLEQIPLRRYLPRHDDIAKLRRSQSVPQFGLSR